MTNSFLEGLLNLKKLILRKVKIVRNLVTDLKKIFIFIFIQACLINRKIRTEFSLLLNLLLLLILKRRIVM
jgi:hypothetical protein